MGFIHLNLSNNSIESYSCESWTALKLTELITMNKKTIKNRIQQLFHDNDNDKE